MDDSALGYLVLGAYGGIGSETARRLRGSGHQVMLAGRREDRLRDLAAAVDSPFCTVDARVLGEVSRAAVQAAEKFGRLDGIVNCVGSVLLKPAHLTSVDEWWETLETNLTSAFAVVRAAYETMRGQGGAVVLISSAAARVGLPNHEAIAAAKAGVIGLMRSAAASYASCRLRFNAIAPGLVQTGMTERIWKSAKSAEVSRAMHPSGRLGEPKDVASLVEWLLRPENDWVTGQVFGVDGGLGTLKVPGRSP